MSDDVSALAAVLDALQVAYRDRIAGGLSTLDDRPESWGFAGMPMKTALHLLRLGQAATPARSPRFLECGSGFGFIAALARELGFVVTGVEVVPSYIEASRRLFPSVRVEEADLLTFDRFGEFDVVYYYGPFADEEIQARFERRVEAELRPGGIVLATRKVTDDWRRAGFTLLWADGASGFAIQKPGGLAQNGAHRPPEPRQSG